jgi:hypothetical protein
MQPGRALIRMGGEETRRSDSPIDQLKDILFADFCQHGQEDLPGVCAADDEPGLLM